MNSKVFLAVRILLGLMLLVFGLNKFFRFLPMGDMPDEAGNYFAALSSTHTMTLVAIVEVLTGVAVLFNKFGALMSLILMSVSVNAVLFHIALAPEGLPPALALLVLNLLALVGYKNKYRELLKG